MVHAPHAQEARRGLRSLRPALGDLLEMHPGNGRGGDGPGGTGQREGEELTGRIARDAGADIVILQRLDPARHLVKGGKSRGTA